MAMRDGARGQARDRRAALRRRGWLAFITAVAAAAVLSMAAAALNVRADWTEDHRYTLSPATLAVLDKLDEPLMIRAWVTRDLPQPYGQLRRFIGDMLAAYHEAGHGKVNYEVKDPGDDPNAAAALSALGVPRVQVQVVENDRAQVKQGYMAVVVEYLNKKEIIPVVRGETGFEYLLTSKIRKITGKGRVKIGVVAGFGARGLDRLQAFKRQVGEDYDLVEVHPDAGPVDKDVRTLIVAGFTKPPSRAMRKAIRAFVAGGGGLLALAGNAEPMLDRGFVVSPIDAKANAWLKEDFGVAVEPGLVMDPRASRINVNQRQGMFVFSSVVDYPFIPSVEGMNAANPVTRGLRAVSVPFASPLEWAGETHGAVLLESSPMAAVQSGPPFDVNPLTPMRERFDGVQRRAVKLALAPEEKRGRVLVVGSPAMLDDEFLGEENRVFVLNALDWLSGNEALIGLRSRGVAARPLAPLDAGARAAWKAAWMLLPPLAVAILGLWRWRRLRRMETRPA